MCQYRMSGSAKAAITDAHLFPTRWEGQDRARREGQAARCPACDRKEPLVVRGAARAHGSQRSGRSPACRSTSASANSEHRRHCPVTNITLSLCRRAWTLGDPETRLTAGDRSTLGTFHERRGVDTWRT
jgi:hypothetical protein